MSEMRFDLAVVGGGINGAGIARDAAGRGLRVLLCEQSTVAAATSSASSKLIHGGLRYLEHGNLRLVRESLREREVLLRIAPHLVRPLEFFLPLGLQRRAAWKIGAGLTLYDWLAGSVSLPRSRRLDLTGSAEGDRLRPEFRRGFSYWDCWGEDARLVAANEMDARERGAISLLRTRCVRAEPAEDGWQLSLETLGAARPGVRARAIVNATGPWVAQFLDTSTPIHSRAGVRLVKGSHIVVERASAGLRALILQHDDGRVVFVLPFGPRFTLIGTTDVPVTDLVPPPSLSEAEAGYLCALASRYLSDPVRPPDIVWSYSGVRALYDDGKANPSAVTRDYRLQLDHAANGAPILSVFGGKLTTYRRLAEQAVDKLAPLLPMRRGAWTAEEPLPGGALGGEGYAAWLSKLTSRHCGLPAEWVEGIARRHGSLAERVLEDVRAPQDLGQHFGAGLTAREIDFMLRYEHAVDAEDILWRRSKAGLELSAVERQAVEAYIAGVLSDAPPSQSPRTPPASHPPSAPCRPDPA
jgi:glycerol-3-phosphate dehydrogenase